MRCSSDRSGVHKVAVVVLDLVQQQQQEGTPWNAYLRRSVVTFRSHSEFSPTDSSRDCQLLLTKNFHFCFGTDVML